jgi:hypothetical protein
MEGLIYMADNLKFDVIVCGGGTSGTAAAVASARAGAKTLIIERLGALGGQMNVFGPPGFSYAHLFNRRGEQIIAGFAEEMHSRLLKENHAVPHSDSNNVYRRNTGYTFSFVDPEWWGLDIFRVMVENDVTLLLHTLVVDVVKDGDKVTGVAIENAAGRSMIEGKIVIDCTGEGDIAVRAGCDYELLPRELNEPHSICFTMDGVDWDEFMTYLKDNPQEFIIKGADSLTEDEKIANLRKLTDPTDIGEIMGFFSILEELLPKGEWHPYAGMGFFMAPRPDGGDHGVVEAHFQHSAQVPNLWSCDPWDLTKGEIEARRQVMICAKAFKNHVPGFKKAYIVKVGTELRLRDGRRIMGDYKLKGADVVSGKRFYDCIGKSAFPAGAVHTADNHTLASSVQSGEVGGVVANEGSHDIPYRCLVPLKVENFLVAGKHVSTERAAYLRFLMQTVVTGQAAGAAAGLCVKKGVSPRELEAENHVQDLQTFLRTQGVILDGVH